MGLSDQIEPLMRAVELRRSSGLSITAKMLNILQSGPKLSSELAAAVGIGTTLVTALLSYHIKSGRVISTKQIDGRCMLSLNPKFDLTLQEQIKSAVRLLRNNGYQVMKGGA